MPAALPPGHHLPGKLTPGETGETRENPAADMGRRKTAVFVEPSLIAKIEFRAWTDDGKLRHPSYKGLRDEDDGNSIYELEP
jgi:ATP-dependent DNA ligase